EMDREAEKLKRAYPGQVISAINYQDESGNQIIRFTPEKEVIFPVGVPIYDENGNQIIGLDNIRAEIERRRDEWARWEREGRLNERVEIHHTDDGKTVQINRQSQHGIGNSQEVSGENSKVLADDGNKNKKPRIEEGGNSVPMEVDARAENCAAEPIIKLLTDDEIKVASEDEITSLIRRLNEELKNRKERKTTSESGFQSYTTQDLKDQSQKLENAFSKFRASNVTVNDDNKNSNFGGIVTAIGMVGVLVIGGVAFVKRSSCNHICSVCRKNTLASIQPNADDTGYSLIKQMVGEAQRKAMRTGERGDVEVSRTVVNSMQTKEKPTIIQLDENQYKHLLIALGNVIRELNSIAFKVKELEGAINKLEGELRLLRIEMKEEK
ncbi:23508_t:CDS:2, partial [Racocetra persica]